MTYASLHGARCPFTRLGHVTSGATRFSLRTAQSLQNAALCTSILFSILKMHRRLSTAHQRGRSHDRAKRIPPMTTRFCTLKLLCFLGFLFSLLLLHIPTFHRI